MSDFDRRKILRKETGWWAQVPGVIQIDQLFDGFVSVLLDLNIAASTVNIVHCNR